MAALETPEVDLTAAIAAALPYSLDLAELNKEKEVPDDKKTYDNFKGLNSAVPDLSTLKFIKGEAPEEPTTGPIVILTWAKYGQSVRATTRHATVRRHHHHHYHPVANSPSHHHHHRQRRVTTGRWSTFHSSCARFPAFVSLECRATQLRRMPRPC